VGLSQRRIATATLVAVGGDLTTMDTDVVVNAANERLAHGGGLAAALVRAGGERIQAESDAWVAANGPLAAGTAAVTGAGLLPAGHIVHVVGPRYMGSPDDPQRLAAAVTAALGAAADLGAATVALPAISAGIFGYPVADACRVITTAAASWLGEHPGTLSEVRLVAFDAAVADAFAAAVESLPAA